MIIMMKDLQTERTRILSQITYIYTIVNQIKFVQNYKKVDVNYNCKGGMEFWRLANVMWWSMNKDFITIFSSYTYCLQP